MLDLAQFDMKGLDLLFEGYERLCRNLAKKIPEDEDHRSDQAKEMLTKLGELLFMLKIVSEEIDKRRAEKLSYSIEDIYRLAGQFDRYVIFKFYRTSEAFGNYGDDAYGWLTYQKKVRDSLESAIQEANHRRSDGVVFLKGASKDKTKNEQLASVGFKASDVMEILVSNNFEYKKQYKKEGLKEIPNTITVEYDPGRFDYERHQIWLYTSKLKNGYTLINEELIQYYCYIFLLYPEQLSEEIKKRFLLLDDTTFNDSADFYIHRSKFQRNLATPKEIKHFQELLNLRISSRVEVLKSQLGISSSALREYIEKNPEGYYELRGVISTFETEVLTTHNTRYPIFWDYERFIHIFSRHYKNFFFEKSTYRGSHFQYAYKDIRRLARLILDALNEEIEEKLSKGKEYRKYADQGFYFNGNYYNLRISPEGKLMQFHPQE